MSEQIDLNMSRCDKREYVMYKQQLRLDQVLPTRALLKNVNDTTDQLESSNTHRQPIKNVDQQL